MAPWSICNNYKLITVRTHTLFLLWPLINNQKKGYINNIYSKELVILKCLSMWFHDKRIKKLSPLLLINGSLWWSMYTTPTPSPIKHDRILCLCPQCPAIDYTRHTLDGAACLLNSNKYFPSRWALKEHYIIPIAIKSIPIEYWTPPVYELAVAEHRVCTYYSHDL